MGLIVCYSIAILFLPDDQIANGVALLISLQQAVLVGGVAASKINSDNLANAWYWIISYHHNT